MSYVRHPISLTLLILTLTSSLTLTLTLTLNLTLTLTLIIWRVGFMGCGACEATPGIGVKMF